jgi:23S rRNA (adenine-N6)-dimethyltransferase
MASDPRRSVRYSQNFLRTPRLAEFLLGLSSIDRHDLVYEIGPGTGTITERLARRCRRVVAVEKDPLLARRLRQRLATEPTVVVEEADFLTVPLPADAFKVFANIPFNGTSAILTALTARPTGLEEACLIVQREAAERFTGEPRAVLGAVLLKPWFEPAIVYRFRREDFIPAPGVEVVLLRLRKRGPPLIAPADRDLFRDLVCHAFTDYRPRVHDTLAALFGARAWRHLGVGLGIEAHAGPTGVTFEQWLVLFHLFKLWGDDRARARIAGAEARLLRQQAGLQKQHRTRTRGSNGHE